MRYAATARNKARGNTSKLEPSIRRSLEALWRIVWHRIRVGMIICNIVNQQKNCLDEADI